MNKLKILIVDDHNLVREGLKITLSQKNNYYNFVVMDEASNGEEAIHKCETNAYDLIFMDINMPIMDGIKATKIIKNKSKNNKIIALTMHSEEFHIKNMINAGASGYILKNTGSGELNKAIRTIMKGERYFSNEVALKLIGNDLENESPEPVKTKINLTRREIQILRLIASGKTTLEISKMLELSKRTVDSHRYNIGNKLNVKNTAKLIQFANKHNLI